MARSPAIASNSLYSSFEWYAARPTARPTPLSLWIGGTTKIIRQNQDLLAHLVEMQIDAIDHRRQANAQPTQED